MRRRSTTPIEDDEQQEVAVYLDARRLLWNHSPQQGAVSYDRRVKLAKMGARAGVPDVMIFERPPLRPDAIGVAIELKRAKQPAPVTPEQRWWLEQLDERGWVTAVCRGAAEAIRLLQALGWS